jgi:hypothetical protein
LNVNASADVNIGYARTVDLTFGAKIDIAAETQNTLDARDHDILADDSISLRIKGPTEMAGEKKWVTMAKHLGTATGAAVTGAVLGGAAGVGVEYLYTEKALPGADDDPSTWGTRLGFPIATTVWGAALGLGIYKKATTDKFQKLSPAQINIKKHKHSSVEDKIELMVGPKKLGSSIVMKKDSITFSVGMSNIKIDSKGVYINGSSLAKITGGNILVQSKSKVVLKGAAGEQTI